MAILSRIARETEDDRPHLVDSQHLIRHAPCLTPMRRTSTMHATRLSFRLLAIASLAIAPITVHAEGPSPKAHGFGTNRSGAPTITTSTHGAPKTAPTHGAPKTTTSHGSPKVTTTFGNAKLAATTHGGPKTTTGQGGPKTTSSHGGPKTTSTHGPST